MQAGHSAPSWQAARLLLRQPIDEALSSPFVPPGQRGAEPARRGPGPGHIDPCPAGPVGMPVLAPSQE